MLRALARLQYERVRRKLEDSPMASPVAFRLPLIPIIFGLLFLTTQSANGQMLAAAGVRPAFLTRGCAGCSEMAVAKPNYGPRTEFMVVHSRRNHIFVGLIGGVLVGVATGAIIANQSAKRCHAESCQVEGALGGLNDMLLGGLAGALVGSVVGAAWPPRN